ncbi:hypothetical protein [Nocardioides sp. R-C-SC26]|uniref:hypothetical protein n=1 Tax=Nocardioides sp. R-C-SC26 TaxID=2870414 RepID=UPI001E635732|nr:hypothetical protein [Nocardioides sp. R-C-SC26]
MNLTRPHRRIATALLLGCLAMTATACSGEDVDTVALDPAGSANADPQPPDGVPAAPGTVRSRNLATVMDTGTPELCLGAIAESYPPQCGGPEITNWDWKRDGQQMFDRQGEIRWGTYAVTGTWDGEAFTVTETIPGPLYDPMMVDPPSLPEPTVDYSRAELRAMADDLGSTLPGAQGGYADEEGHVLVDVVYDDGSIQAYVDEKYGDGVVVVTGALVDA